MLGFRTDFRLYAMCVMMSTSNMSGTKFDNQEHSEESFGMKSKSDQTSRIRIYKSETT